MASVRLEAYLRLCFSVSVNRSRFYGDEKRRLPLGDGYREEECLWEWR